MPVDPWRDDEKVNSTAAKGEVSLNLVDLMEFSWLHSGSLKGMQIVSCEPENQIETKGWTYNFLYKCFIIDLVLQNYQLTILRQ